jgi:hypothetical protein
MPIKYNYERIPIDDVFKPLSSIVADIEALLKPYQHWTKVEIEKRNGEPKTIRISVEINNPK